MRATPELSSRRASRPQGPPDFPARQAEQGEPAVGEVTATTVAEIGKGVRWYDLAYRFLNRLQHSNFGGSLPTRWHGRLRTATNFMYQTQHAEWLRQRRRPVHHWGSIKLPVDENISIPAVWVAEYFTASQVGRLYEAMRRAGWSEARFIGTGSGGAESLLSSRGGQGATWWRIAELTSRDDAHVSVLGPQRATLPRGVESVNLIGVSVGKGITAVIAGFSLDKSVSAHLNEELHVRHRPSVIRRPGHMAVAQSSNAVLYNRVQTVRADMHKTLRCWMSQSVPGKFAQSGWDHPLFDLVFFDVADPFNADALDLRMDLKKNDALRAVGITDFTFHYTGSDEVPGLLLELPQRSEMTPDLTENVWTLWGNKRAVADLTAETGSSGELGAAHQVGENMTDFVARSGLTVLLRLMRADASVAHDTARQQYGGASSRNLRRLRERLLTTSLDLTTLEGDIREYNGRNWRNREPQFLLDQAPWLKKLDEDEGRRPQKPLDLNKYDRKLQKRLAQELVAFDVEYREVLSTVASLSASIDSRRVQRVATWVSVASLVVAGVTLWATSNSSQLIRSAEFFIGTLIWW